MATWEAIGAAKRQAVLASIPAEWHIPASKLPSESILDVSSFASDSGLFTARELEITSLTAESLLQKLLTQEWTSEEITRAICKRAAAAHQLTNCLSEVFFEEAIARAKSLDETFRETGKPIGPLHGLPISLKDNFNLVGKDSTVGFATFANDPATYDSVLVELLRDAGAVFYVKTNVPTAMMIAESVNNVFGRTVNPLNRNCTSGGSSGGESALIAFGGSVLGVGTDIGGSLRIPAACTGIYTLRPSFGRFPTLKCRSGLTGQEAVNSVNGPMSRSLSDLALFARTVVSASPWLSDPKMLPIPWRSVTLPTTLKIGVLWHDGIITPTPPVQRALKTTVEKLRKAGHQIVDWNPALHSPLLSTLGKFFIADGGSTVRSILSRTSEPWRPEMSAYELAPTISVADMWALQAERTTLMKKYLDQWNESGIDCILAPTTPYASVRNGMWRHVGYTGVFNVVDYAATSFPTGVTADKELDAEYGPEVGVLGEEDGKVRETYEAGLVHGLPVSLQLVGRRLEEEKVLEMTGAVLKAL
ncbi:amidase, partial [Pseudovirgaria hyperparasitica]